jgi:heptose I phosphotransferase
VIELCPRADDCFRGLAFGEFLALGSELVKVSRDGTRRTAAFERAGRRYFVKTHAGAGWREIAKNWLSLKAPVLDAGTEARALLLAEARGLPAPRLVACASRARIRPRGARSS